MTYRLLDPTWMAFRLKLADDREFADFLVVYRCPDCGSLIDWRGHADHLRHHGVTDDEQIADLVRRQESWAGITR